MALRKGFLGRHAPVAAIGAQRLASRAIPHGCAPFVLGLRRAAPPADAGRPRDYITRRRLPVSRRVPLGRDARETRREAIGARDSPVRAERTSAAGGAIVGLRAPDVIATFGASPPNHPSRARADRLWRERSIAFAIPLLDQVRISRDPVTRSSKRRRRPAHGCARDAQQRACLPVAHDRGASCRAGGGAVAERAHPRRPTARESHVRTLRIRNVLLAARTLRCCNLPKGQVAALPFEGGTSDPAQADAFAQARTHRGWFDI
jgi:hypothetical protein